MFPPWRPSKGWEEVGKPIAPWRRMPWLRVVISHLRAPRGLDWFQAAMGMPGGAWGQAKARELTDEETARAARLLGMPTSTLSSLVAAEAERERVHAIEVKIAMAEKRAKWRPPPPATPTDEEMFHVERLRQEGAARPTRRRRA